MTRLLVVGGGIAGAAACFRASELGFSTVWVQGRAGASAFGSGAADLVPWAEAADNEPLPPELERFVGALGAFRSSTSRSWVLGSSGLVRPARLIDPLVLDLAPLAGRTVGLPQGLLPAVLANAANESAWAGRTKSRFEMRDVSLTDDDAAALAVSELDTAVLDTAVVNRLAEALARASASLDAWLVPATWLAGEAGRAAIERRVERAVGSPLGDLGGALALRLARRLADFSPPGVERKRGFIEALETTPSGITACFEGSSDKPSFDAAVLCVGGLSGGGIVGDERRGVKLSLAFPGVEFEVPFPDGGAQRLDAAAPGGVDFCALGHAALLRLGLRARDGALGPKVFVAGDARSGVPRTLLGAAQSAIDVLARVSDGTLHAQ